MMSNDGKIRQTESVRLDLVIGHVEVAQSVGARNLARAIAAALTMEINHNWLVIGTYATSVKDYSYQVHGMRSGPGVLRSWWSEGI